MNKEKMSGFRKYHFYPSELKIKDKTIQLSVPVKLGLEWGVFFILAILTIVLNVSTSENDSRTTNQNHSTTISEKNEEFFSEEINKIELNQYANVNELISTYYSSYLSADLDSLKSIVVDETALYPKSTYEALGAYIESYQDINCYTLKLEENESVIVLATYETKFKGVDTLAPGTGLFYVINIDSTPIIDNTFSQNSKLDGKVNEFANNPKIVEITSDILEEYNTALESDADLKAMIEEMSHSATEENVEDTSEETPSEETPSEETAQTTE